MATIPGLEDRKRKASRLSNGNVDGSIKARTKRSRHERDNENDGTADVSGDVLDNNYIQPSIKNISRMNGPSDSSALFHFLPCHLTMLQSLYHHDNAKTLSKANGDVSTAIESKDKNKNSNGKIHACTGITEDEKVIKQEYIWKSIHLFLDTRRDMSLSHNVSNGLKGMIDEAKLVINQYNEYQHEHVNGHENTNLNECEGFSRDQEGHKQLAIDPNDDDNDYKFHTQSLSLITQSQQYDNSTSPSLNLLFNRDVDIHNDVDRGTKTQSQTNGRCNTLFTSPPTSYHTPPRKHQRRQQSSPMSSKQSQKQNNYQCEDSFLSLTPTHSPTPTSQNFTPTSPITSRNDDDNDASDNSTVAETQIPTTFPPEFNPFLLVTSLLEDQYETSIQNSRVVQEPIDSLLDHIKKIIKLIEIQMNDKENVKVRKESHDKLIHNYYSNSDSDSDSTESNHEIRQKGESEKDSDENENKTFNADIDDDSSVEDHNSDDNYNKKEDKWNISNNDDDDDDDYDEIQNEIASLQCKIVLWKLLKVSLEAVVK